jgi:hypothetical protein
MEEGVELCARALSLSLCAAGAHAREQLRCNSLAILHAFFGTLWGLGLHGLLLIWYYAFRVEAMRYFHLGACQIPENNPTFSAVLLQHRRKKSSTSSSKGFFSFVSGQRVRE